MMMMMRAAVIVADLLQEAVGEYQEDEGMEEPVETGGLGIQRNMMFFANPQGLKTTFSEAAPRCRNPLLPPVPCRPHMAGLAQGLLH